MFKSNILKAISVSMAAGSLFFIYNKIFPQDENDEIPTSLAIGEREKKELVREKIFRDDDYIENEFDHSLLSKDKWNSGGTSRQKIEENLARLVKKRLEEKFSNNNIGGRIYYELRDLSLEVYVMWKMNKNSKEYNYYDRFEIALTQ